MTAENDAYTVTLQGTHTINTAETTLQKLKEALSASASEVVADCADLEEFDLTFVQLMIAARRSAERAGKRFRLVSPASGALLSMLMSLGVVPSGPSLAADGFWAAGE
ncbi:MAG: STAS domain-containing protein [Magnetospirillum sp.]|nr:STAS domain-containing protein [Magnetospirillum sp.]